MSCLTRINITRKIVMTAPTIGFICGSLRQGSINKKLQTALCKKVEAAGAATEIVDLSNYDLPLFHGDLEAPKAVTVLTELLKTMDGIIIISPEYNGGLPPVLKNMIDWTSTVERDHFTNPIYGVASCTPGPMSGIMCMRQINYILMRLGAEVMPVQVGTGNASKAFDQEGALIAQPSSDLADKMVSGMLKRIAQKEA